MVICTYNTEGTKSLSILNCSVYIVHCRGQLTTSDVINLQGYELVKSFSFLNHG